MSDLLLRVARRDGGHYRNPWLAPGTSIPLLLVLLLVVAVFFPSLFTPYTPEQMDFSAILQPPDLRHWFGTDQLGRDVFTRVVYGTSLSLSIGVGATLIASAGGIVLGTLAGLAPRAVRQLLVRLLDIMLAFPDLLLALLAITVLGRGPENTLLAVGLAGIGARASVAGQVIGVCAACGGVGRAANGDYFAPYCAQYAAPAAGTGNGGDRVFHIIRLGPQFPWTWGDSADGGVGRIAL